MLLAVLLSIAIDPSAMVPMRWPSTDPKSLTLLEKSSINTLVFTNEPPAPFRDAAKAKNLQVVLLGKDVPVFERGRLPLDGKAPLIATAQGVWPGINIKEEEQEALPSGAPWIDTNSGFLRFARAATTSEIWLANLPPARQVIPVERYIQAVADAAMIGGKWVIALDDDFAARLLSGDFKAGKDWERLNSVIRFYEEHKEWREQRPAGQMTVVQDVSSGALLSGGVLDMVATKHTPVRPVPIRSLTAKSFDGAQMAVNVDPASLSAEQKAALTQFTRKGGTVLSAPPGWKMPEPRPDQLTLDKEELEKLDQIWKEMNSMTGRKNLGARLFNVSSMLSNLTMSADGRTVMLQLVNYTSYPIEDITVHMLGPYKKATFHTPEDPPKVLELFEADEGSGAEIAKISTVGAVVFERE